MKKLVVSLLCLLTLGMINVHATELPEVTDHEKVTIYVFRGDGCGFCQKALTYLHKLGDTYDDYLKIVTYEVWSNSNNNALMSATAEALGDTLKGVPYIVVGDFSINGFTDAMGAELIENALKQYEDEKYVDKVAEVAKDHPNAKVTSFYDALVAEGIIKPEKNTTVETIIILGIFAVIIGGGAALVVFSRRK